MEDKKEYVIYITETLQKKIIIEATSMSEAIEIAAEKYYKEEIVLDSQDYLDTDFNAVEKK